MRHPHVWEVAQAVSGRSTSEGIAWAKQSCSWLVHGEIEVLITSMEVLPKPYFDWDYDVYRTDRGK
jgi:hypothetical protein